MELPEICDAHNSSESPRQNAKLVLFNGIYRGTPPYSGINTILYYNGKLKW